LEQKSSWAKSLGLFAVILSEFAGAMAVGVLAGLGAQKYWGAPGWTIILTSFLGFCLGMYRVYLVSNQAVGDANDNDPE
jgi:F0F1-type ATP synthase assembly protein I